MEVKNLSDKATTIGDTQQDRTASQQKEEKSVDHISHAPTLAELEEENRRLRALLAEATKPLVSSSPMQPGIVDLSQMVDMEGTEKVYFEGEDGTDGNGVDDSENLIKPAKRQKKDKWGRERPRSREKSRDMIQENKAEKKKQHHVNKVREAHWEGRMDGRMGNLKPTPVADKPSLRLRQPRENAVREPNPAMQALPITPKQQELRTAMVTGVRLSYQETLDYGQRLGKNSS